MPSVSNCRGFLFTYNFKQRFFACFTKQGDAFLQRILFALRYYPPFLKQLYLYNRFS